MCVYKLLTRVIPLYNYTTVCFIHSSVEGHLGVLLLLPSLCPIFSAYFFETIYIVLYPKLFVF